MLKYEDLPKVNSERWLSLEDLEGEVWRRCPQYSERIAVSNYGRLKRIPYTVTKEGISHLYREKIYKLQENRNGYYKATLRLKQNMTKMVQVHRAVAFAFIDNPSGFQIINHKDENPSNNCAYNLEWCTTYYNNNYGNRNKKVRERRIAGGYTKAVVNYSYNGEKLKEYVTAKDAAINTGVDRTSIINCCNGISPTACGLHFRYAGEKYQKRAIKNERFFISIYKDGAFLFSTNNTKDMCRKLSINYSTFRMIVKYGKEKMNGLKGYVLLVRSCQGDEFVINNGVKEQCASKNTGSWNRNTNLLNG